MTTSAAESKSYPIDDCFGKSIGRENLDKLTSLNLNEDSGGDGEMITFVEFIRGQKKKKSDGILRNEAFESLFFNYFDLNDEFLERREFLCFNFWYY